VETSHILCLCTQLAEVLRRDVPTVHVSTLDIENVGLCVRFAPLESARGEFVTVNIQTQVKSMKIKHSLPYIIISI